MGEDGLHCSSSAVETRLGPTSLLEERSETPHCFCCFFCVVGYSPNWGKQPRYIEYIDIDEKKSKGKLNMKYFYPDFNLELFMMTYSTSSGAGETLVASALLCSISILLVILN